MESPLDPIRLDIPDPRWLRPDDDGGLHLDVDVSDLLGRGPESSGKSQKAEEWTIEYLELEVTGQTK